LSKKLSDSNTAIKSYVALLEWVQSNYQPNNITYADLYKHCRVYHRIKVSRKSHHKKILCMILNINRLKKSIVTILFFSFYISLGQSNHATILIHTKNPHNIKIGASGFNVRIADKVWNYTHPDFINTVKELKPGWLRYFSGTMGDAFSSATGQYDLDYIAMFKKQKQYFIGHRFTETKGPHRLTDLYALLGEINAKLIITVNAFSETPEMILELARFCKNNNIKVEAWQFCNEPYFYTPNRSLYWWNDGYDYAVKMQPYAEAIKQIFPQAQLTLNYTWDGVWTFMKDIYKFQKEHGNYWNVFSKHSYAPHIGKKETLEQAYKRANTKIIEATSPSAMAEIEDYTWQDVPMMITEFGVWNKPLNGIYASIYNIEYVMRQLQHTNTQYVGAHEISNKYYPLENKNHEIEHAFKNKTPINTDTLLTGIHRDLEGKAYKIYHEATNNSEYLYDTKISRIPQVLGLDVTNVNGMFAQTYKGINGYNYLVVTNRSAESNKFQIKIDNTILQENIETFFISGENLSTKDTTIKNETFKNGLITVKPYSLSVHKWKTDLYKLAKPTIYKTNVEKEGILLKWGEVVNASHYKLYYGTKNSNLNKTVLIEGKNHVLVKDLIPNTSYFFKIEAPKIFKVSRRDDTVTLFWQSVANANGYLINYLDKNLKAVTINTQNVFGYRIEGLKDKIIYNFTITAYNGLGKGEASAKESVLVSARVPLSPRNVSAIKKTINSNSIEVKWIPQKKVLSNTCYNVYRGKKLHEFTKIASCIKDTVYVDNAIASNTKYYYTVKAVTEAGESNFHPNIATAFLEGNNNKINIQGITTQEAGYLVKVELNGMTVNPKDNYGIIISNVSFLNVEHVKILGVTTNEKQKSFRVFIPNSKLSVNSKYAIKAFVEKQGNQIESAIVNQYISKK